MQCVICLSHYGGPLGVCVDCLLTIYPHGISPWVGNNGRMMTSKLPVTPIGSHVPVH